MKKIYYLLITALLLLFLCACSNAESTPTEISLETIPVETEQICITESPATIAHTEPTKPEIPYLGEAAGSRYECYYSDSHDDYLNYYVHIPENAVTEMPLIVYLHGDGEVNKPHGLPKRGIKLLTEKVYGIAFPFILLEPNTRIKSWTQGDIPELLIGLIDRVADRYSVNKDKIIITGHSRGAIGVWDMISIYGNYFSAAVPISSPHQKGHIDYIKAAEVPVWTFAGDIGDIECWYHDFLEKNVEMIEVSGGYGKFTVLKGCDHGKAKNEAYVKETFEWMLAQQRGIIPEE